MDTYCPKRSNPEKAWFTFHISVMEGNSPDSICAFTFSSREMIVSVSKLQEVMEVAEPVLEKLKDTYMAVGAEAYLAGRVFYDSVKASSKAGTPGSDVIAANLGEIFRRSRPKAQPVIEDTRK